MRRRLFKSLIGLAFVGGTLTIGAGAQAYWGDPWGGPRTGPGWRGGPWSEPGGPPGGFRGMDQTHQRQSQMRDHRAAMQSLGRMLSGRRNFDRAEAIALAREIEASAGDNLTRLFKTSGDWRRSPLSRARVGDDIDIFQSHANALQLAAGELADQLEKQPSAEDIRSGRAWSPDWSRGRPYRSHWRDDNSALNREVFNAYNNLRSTCNGCHANFRTAWR